MSLPLVARLALGMALAVAVAAPAAAQSYSSSSSSTLDRRTAGGGDFPTWEREVGSDERFPLPTGWPGRYVPAWTLDLGVAPAGVAFIGAPGFIVALADGAVLLVGSDGVESMRIDAGSRITLPPVEAGSLALVVAGERLVAVTRTGIAWRSQAGGRILRAPVVAGDAAFIVREGGTLERLGVADGIRAWSIDLGADAGTEAAASSALVAVGLRGDVAAFDAATGAPRFRVIVGDAVHAVLLTETGLYATGLGRSGRSSDVTPVAVGQVLQPRSGAPDGRPWRLRVGGTCTPAPLPLDNLIALACADGYVRAVERRKGVGGWRMDLPSATAARPLLTGSRLDVVIPQSRHVVALQSDNGAVLGWVELPDEDETFLPGAAVGAAVTVTPTSFARLLAWTWESSTVGEEAEEGFDDSPAGRAAQEEELRRGSSAGGLK